MMYIKRLLTVFALGLGLTLALLWLLESDPAVAAPTANLVVTKLTDSADGACDSDCSLREAVIAANDNPGADVISLPLAGTYELTITGANEGYAATGDLDIRDDLTIIGQGPGATLIDANGIDLVLSLYDSTVVISGVTVYGGSVIGQGGGIVNWGGDLTLVNVAVVSNTATSSGGGIRLDGTDAVLTLGEDCLVAGNEAGDGGGGLSMASGTRALLVGGRIVSNTAIYGGGVYDSLDSSIMMSGVQIISNTASFGGGVYLKGTATLNEGAILSNTASSGGGLFVSTGTFTQAGQSIIAYNTAQQRGGGIQVSHGTVVLNGGQISHNRVTGAVDNSYGGGGIYVGAGIAATLIQSGSSAIVENSAAMHGGGMIVEWGKVTLNGGQILSNTAGKNGGGIYLYSAATLTQTGGLIAYNEAQGTDSDQGGGGLYSSNDSNSISLHGGQIMANRANKGGGLNARIGSFDLLGAEIISNHATLFGGGVYAGALGWSAQLEGGRIISNSAEYGGGLYAAQGNVTLARAQIVGNQASAAGGGVYHDTEGHIYHVLTLVNTTISGNSAPDGSALANASGTTLLTYTTVASNTTASAGYGIQKGTGSILARNTIIAYNDHDNCAEGAVTSNDHNLDSDGTCDFAGDNDQSEVDPELAPLASDLGTLVHAITPGSPPHDSGDCQTGILTDQRGVHRLAPCDVGAYEYGKVYTLTVATDGTGAGLVAPPLGTHFYLDSAEVPITATAGSHSTFVGWSGDLGGSTSPTSITMDGDKVVTATFDLLTYTLSVATSTPDTGSGAVDPPVGTHVYDYGSTVWLTATADAGSTFLGWEGAAVGLTNPASIVITDDASITATFTAQQVHTLTLATDGTGTGTVNPPVGQHGYISGTTVWLTATADSDSTFVGWSGDLDSIDNPTSITIDGNKTVTATFDLIPDVYYTLTVATDGTGVGTVDPSVGTHSYLSGTVVPIAAAAGLNSTFEGWSGDLGGTTNPTSITMDGNKAVTATFDLIPGVYYTLTVATDGTGVGTVDPSVGAHSYLSGTVVPITATASSNSIFEGWSGDLDGSTNPTSITMDGDKTVTATFIIAPYITYLPLVMQSE